jgi:drug/metabolite transporter (DMT)-like permease
VELFPSRYAHIISGLGFSFIFGFSFFFTAEALMYLDPFHILSFRFLLAALVLGLLKVGHIVSLPLGRIFLDRQVLLLVLLQPVLYFAAETVGLKLTSSSEAGLMVALIPIFVSLFSAVFYKEPPKKLQVPFILLSVAGVALIVVMQGRVNLAANYLGTFLLLVAVVAAALYNLLTRQLISRYSPLALTFCMMIGGALAFTAISLTRFVFLGTPALYFTPLADSRIYGPLLYLGVLCSVTGFFLINYTLTRVTAPQVAVFANLSTVVAVAAGVLLRQEAFFPYHLWGGLFIIAGVAGTNIFGDRRQEARLPAANPLSVQQERSSG